MQISFQSIQTKTHHFSALLLQYSTFRLFRYRKNLHQPLNFQVGVLNIKRDRERDEISLFIYLFIFSLMKRMLCKM